MPSNKRVPDAERKVHNRQPQFHHQRRTPLQAAAQDHTLGEGTEPDPVEARARLRMALSYLMEAKPGKRLTALTAVWRAVTGAEDLQDWRRTDAARHYQVFSSIVRNDIRRTIGRLGHDEPSTFARGVFAEVVERLLVAEAEIVNVKKMRRRRGGRPVKR